jgi:hypothetical protein
MKRGYESELTSGLFSDTVAALRAVECTLPVNASQQSKGRAVFIHQLYAILENKTKTDSEIQRLAKEGVVRPLHSAVGGDMAIMLTEEWRVDCKSAHLQSSWDSSESRKRPRRAGGTTQLVVPEAVAETESNELVRALECVSGANTAVSETELLQVIQSHTSRSGLSISKSWLTKSLQTLAKKGYLRERSSSAGPSTEAGKIWWLTHPTVQSLGAALVRGRKNLEQMLQRRKKPEITHVELAKKAKAAVPSSQGKGPSSSSGSTLLPLGIRFHLFDLLGKCTISRIDLPGNRENAYLYRLASEC